MSLADKPFMRAEIAGLRLGLPGKWFAKEVQAGRIPGFLVGKSWFVHVDTAKESLVKRTGVKKESATPMEGQTLPPAGEMEQEE